MASIADIAPSLAAGLGVTGMANVLAVPEIQHGVICLIDGLGAELLDRYPGCAPTLTAGGVVPGIDTVFPSTTPTALASLGTGMPPGGHGLIGAAFILPETGAVLSPLSWGAQPSPSAVQPEPTVFERAARQGIRVSTIAKPDYAESGLTRAVLRGADYRGTDAPNRLSALRAALRGSGPTLTYLYLPEVDRVGHEFGVASGRWRDTVRQVDDFVAQVVDALPANAAMIVTADHGMVDCPAESRVVIEAHPELCADVETIAGEPRVRQLYTRAGQGERVAERWRGVLGGRARVLLRTELIDSGLLGPVEEFAAERVGDVVVIAEGDLMLASRVDPLTSSLLGQHGAVTADEWRIPAIWFTTVA